MAKERQTSTDETEELSERNKLALEFAKALANQVIHDPQGKTSRRPSRSYSPPTRESISNALQSPSTSEKILRDSSIFLYQINTRYRNLINYYAQIPCWAYVVSPVNYNPDKAKKESFRKQYVKICNILESMAIPKTMREIVVTALREGVYYGCIWGGSGDSFILQKLDPDKCVIVSISDGGVFQFKYDMSSIKEGDVSTYFPPKFTDMYEEYLRTGERYQLVPPEIAVCFKADPTIVEYSIPVFAGVMPTLFQIENAKALSEAAEEQSNYKLLAGKIPVDDQGIPLIDYETVMQYYKHIANNVGEMVGVAVSPFELKDYSFEQSTTAAQINAISRANENFFAEAGTSALLHGATNDTSGVTKLAIRVDESFGFSCMYQCERIVNRFLKLLPGTVKFKIHFLDVSIFNRDEKIEEYRSSMNYGIGKLEFCAVMDIPQHDILGENYIESELIGINDLFVPMRTASTQSSDDTSDAGRPRLDDGDLSDEGENTRDGDKDANR